MPEQYRTRDYNADNATASLDAKSPSTDSVVEIFDYPGGFNELSDGLDNVSPRRAKMLKSVETRMGSPCGLVGKVETGLLSYGHCSSENQGCNSEHWHEPTRIGSKRRNYYSKASAETIVAALVNAPS